jgi:hypothetical protein
MGTTFKIILSVIGVWVALVLLAGVGDRQGAVESIEKQIDRILAAEVTAQEQTRDAIRAARQDLLQVLAKGVSPEGTSMETGANRAAAGQRAMDLGDGALAEGLTEKALLYFINGLNHDPGRVALVRRMVDAALAVENPQMVAHALEALELAARQVPPDDMQEVLTGLAALRAAAAPQPAQALAPEQALKVVQRSEALLTQPASAREIADFLVQLDALAPGQAHLDVHQIEARLLPRLRDQVQREAQALHQRALEALSYPNGYELARQAGEVLALYPISDAPEILKQANALSIQHQDVLHRLGLMRLERYNHWAAGQVDKALQEIRVNGKKGCEAAMAYLGTIEPSLLEPSVAPPYARAIDAIQEKFDKDEAVATPLHLTDETVTRRGLEGF